MWGFIAGMHRSARRRRARGSRGPARQARLPARRLQLRPQPRPRLRVLLRARAHRLRQQDRSSAAGESLILLEFRMVEPPSCKRFSIPLRCCVATVRSYLPLPRSHLRQHYHLTSGEIAIKYKKFIRAGTTAASVIILP